MPSFLSGMARPLAFRDQTPYEPGSTLKPLLSLVLSRMISRHLKTRDVENGTWTVAGRTLHDVHSQGRMSIADALRVSSN
ncbi:MAG: hypothetical protein CM1200mP14_20470 [Gammaproteobacteria bacterium]|nr:MAG: hypothetical protein CM1200mP14_20470 [Gammaproteobacteria bacterium]